MIPSSIVDHHFKVVRIISLKTVMLKVISQLMYINIVIAPQCHFEVTSSLNKQSFFFLILFLLQPGK